MQLTEPITFEPLYMERIWGGRRLALLYGKNLPNGVRVGESWELVDRPEAQSVVHNGLLRGKTLHELWSNHRAAVFGERAAALAAPRFPLLFKMLDAEERLSVQVHPPAALAAQMKGEPKTEMWHVIWAEHDAELYAGLRAGTTRASFEHALANGTVAGELHRLPSRAGDTIFIPSGRVHAIGAGNVIVEIQQNSDTTYRVFDWNRLGTDGKARELHVAESLRSIDFEDPEPQYQPPGASPLVACPYFEVDRRVLDAPYQAAPPGEFAVVTLLTGAAECGGMRFKPGEFFLLPANMEDRTLLPAEPTTSLLITRLP